MEIAKNNFDLSSDIEISIALGLFDSVHIAHQKIIKQAKETADKMGISSAVMTFSLTNKNQIKPRNKQNVRMVLSNDDRLQKFKNLGIDIVYIPEFYSIKNLSPEDFFYEILLNKCNVKAITCGYDYRFGSGGLGTTTLLEKLCKDNEIELTVIKQQKLDEDVISSKLIRGLLEIGDVIKANSLLGYEYSTNYVVAQGDQMGRKIGIQTANQILDENLIILRYGVYKTTTTIKGKTYKSITSVGVKPTFEGERVPLSETHIFDFDENIYGEVIEVNYQKFIRDEQKFSNVDELKTQIDKDIAECKQ